MRRDAVRRVGVPVAALLVVLLVLLLVGALGRWVLLVGLTGLGLAVGEVVLQRVLGPAFPLQRELLLGELSARVPLELALVLVLVVRLDGMSAVARGVFVVAVVAHQLLRTAHTVASHAVERLAVPRAQARNLEGVRPAPRPRTPLVGQRGLEVVVAATALPSLGLVIAAATGSYALVAPAAVLMALVAAAVVGVLAPGLLVLLRRPGGRSVVHAVNEAVLRHRPEVVFYSSGLVVDVHWVTSWLDTLDELGKRGRPALVLVRDPQVFDALPSALTPVLCLPEDRDVRAFVLPQARVALYPANAPENAVLLRRPELRSAFVGHGDSDKAASARPIAKMYDEVWVAGEAGRDRYLRADVGVRPDAIRVVGRPQVRRIARRSLRTAGEPLSVLYAPTWEGFDDDSGESSLLLSGREVVRRLLAMPDVRVLYRPHPATGVRDPRFAEADRAVLTALEQAGPPHAVVGSATTPLHTALNTADVLVTDVTSVVSEFLASGKPYVIVNATELDAEAFHERFPSTTGALLVGRDAAGLEAAVEDARGADTMRAARERLRSQLIGPPTDDPVGLFAAAVDALGDTLGPRSSRAPGAPGGAVASGVRPGG